MVQSTTAGRPVILVDDDATVRLPLELALRAALSCSVNAFADGPSALVFAESTEIGLALLDVDMFPMNGPELAARLRTLYPDLPVLFLTGSTEEDLGDLVSATQPAAVLRKPIATTTLVALIEKHRRR